ncbi:MAG: hypothetical protein U1F43_17300 [Myxococcota bacterium]
MCRDFWRLVMLAAASSGALTACADEPAEFLEAVVLTPHHLGEDEVPGWSPALPEASEATASFELSRAELLQPDEGRPIPSLVLMLRVGPDAVLEVAVNGHVVAELPTDGLGAVVDGVADALGCQTAAGLGDEPEPFHDAEHNAYLRSLATAGYTPAFVDVPWSTLVHGRNEVRIRLVGSEAGQVDDEALVGYAAITTEVDGCAERLDLVPDAPAAPR